MDRSAAERGLTRVVGVGASAGGLDALLNVVRTLPADLPVAICIVLHLPATGRSLLGTILDRRTEFDVRVASDGELLQPGRAYVAPPDRHLTVAGGRLELGSGPKENGVRPAVDPLLRSLAEAYGAQAVAVILSGALRRRQRGGARGKAGGRHRDRAGSRRRGGDEHARGRDPGGRRRGRGARGGRDRPGARAARPARQPGGMNGDPAFEALLEFLKRARGFDFTGYKRTSLERRFRRRMEAIGCESYGDYLDHLEVDPEEYEQLFDALLINVTEFFRDPPAWDHLRQEALPGLLAAADPGEAIRVWCAGCATGQEAYTVAMALAEVLGEDAFRERVKIYATDVDEDALAIARAGVYGPKETEGIPEELRSKYFERADKRLAFRADLRRTVIFGRNNLVSDAPISRLDLLICRNTLMYFTAETQGRVLRHFHFALHEHGLLMLGKSEMMTSHRDMFTAVDLKTRIFRRLERTPSLQARVAGMTAGNGAQIPLAQVDGVSRDAALELGPHAQIIVSRAGAMTFANLPARALFGIGAESIGRPLQEVELS